MLTSFSDRERILRALDAGAAGYLLKDAEPDELERAVRAAARGDAPLDPKAARALLSGAHRGVTGATQLSEREREVLLMVAEGLPNKLIARRLEISEKTVKAHLTSVFRRIGVTDRTQAALWAERNGLTREVVGPTSDCGPGPALAPSGCDVGPDRVLALSRSPRPAGGGATAAAARVRRRRRPGARHLRGAAARSASPARDDGRIRVELELRVAQRRAPSGRSSSCTSAASLLG